MLRKRLTTSQIFFDDLCYGMESWVKYVYRLMDALRMKENECIGSFFFFLKKVGPKYILENIFAKMSLIIGLDSRDFQINILENEK